LISRRLRRIWGACSFAVVGLVLALPGVASAQYPGGSPTPSPTVGGERFFRGDEGLGRTGFDIILILAIALAIVGLGLVVRWFSRRAATRES
jgi:hypothetical protein